MVDSLDSINQNRPTVPANPKPAPAARKITIFDLGEKDFTSIFPTHILPKLKYKNLRAKKSVVLLLIYISLAVILGSALAEFFVKKAFLNLFFAIILVLALGVLIMAAYVFSLLKKNIVKEESIIKETFFNLISIAYDKQSSWLDFTVGINPEVWRLFPPFNQNSALKNFAGESLSFTYKGQPVSVIDIENEKKNKSEALLILTKINKTCSRNTIINTNRMGLTYHLFKESLMREVPFKNEEIAKDFLVFSQDVMEASQFLKETFMKKLAEYKYQHNCTVDIAFSGEMSDKYNTFICIIPRKNYFDFKGKYGQAKTYYNFLEELKNILVLIDALNLEEEITK